MLTVVLKSTATAYLCWLQVTVQKVLKTESPKMLPWLSFFLKKICVNGDSLTLISL